MQKLLQHLQKPLTVGVILFIITAFITLQDINGGMKSFDGGREYNKYNNYTIFKQSYFHLIENKDLYVLHPEEHWDLFKYSPTFALAMAPLANLPDGVGLMIWNLLNAFVLFFAIWKFPNATDRTRLFMTAFVLIELITSMQNEQSNGLIAGLIIFAFNFLEKRKIAWASLCIVTTVFIKLFGIAAFALFLFYPDKVKAFLHSIGWSVLFLILPLLAISGLQLLSLYESYLNMLQNDHDASYGFSVAGVLHTWFNLENIKNTVMVAGCILFLLPLIKFKQYKEVAFRILFLAFILLWIVIFNHKAESPTFVIAVAGIAVWYFTQTVNKVNTALVIFTFLFTVLAATDIFPRTVRVNFMVPYYIKALPCILVWCKIFYELMLFRVGEISKEHVS